MVRFLGSLAFCFVLSLAPALAAPQSLDAFLHGIYSRYGNSMKSGGEGVLLNSADDMRRYFTDDLVAMVEADEKEADKRGDVPTLDGDPFIGSQDWDVTNLKIHIDSQTATDARATVTFVDSKHPRAVRLALVNTPKGWRIVDVFWDDGSFRQIYTDAFVRDIYDHYRGDADTTAKGIALTNRKTIAQYFAPDIAAVMTRDEETAARAGDEPSLEFDPFVSAQDWKISDIKVSIVSQRVHGADAVVHFKNLGKAETVKMALVQTPAGWRISDITWPDGNGTLRALYKTK